MRLVVVMWPALMKNTQLARRSARPSSSAGASAASRDIRSSWGDRNFAFPAAADTLRDALALVRDDATRLRMLLDLGNAQLQAGRVTNAWETFDRAHKLARMAGDSDAAAHALLGRTERLPSTGEAAELAGLVERALREVGSDPSEVRVRLLTRYASLRVAGGAMNEGSAAAAQALAAARSLGDDVLLCDALTVRHVTLRGPDDVAAAEAISAELVDVAAQSGAPDHNLEAAMARLVDQLRLGDITGVDRTLERYQQLAVTTGLPRYRFFVDSRRGMRAFLAGRLAEGEAMLERARRIGEAIEEPDTEYVFGGARVMVLADLTDRDEVITAAQHAEAVAAVTGDSRLLIFAAYLRSSANDHGYDGATFHLVHMVGLQHLARLLAAGGSEVHVLELASPIGERPRQPQSRHDLLDAKAKAAYRQRIADLRQEQQEAEDNNDFERAERARAELDLIVEELRRAVGLGGRSRTATDNAERARVAVRKAITTALDRLAEHDTTFAQHLRIHIRTGIYCRYETDPTNPIEWNTSA